MSENQANISGGTLHGGQVFAVGGNPVVNNAATHVGTVDDLRADLERIRGAIVAAGQDEEERGQLDAEVGTVLKELQRPEPRPAVVRGRWELIRSITGGVLANSGNLVRITETIANLFPG